MPSPYYKKQHSASAVFGDAHDSGQPHRHLHEPLWQAHLLKIGRTGLVSFYLRCQPIALYTKSYELLRDELLDMLKEILLIHECHVIHAAQSLRLLLTQADDAEQKLCFFKI